MCFSAEASFIASATITTVGIIAYKKAYDTSSEYLAVIPIFFGLQQFCEGMVWLASQSMNFAGLLSFSTFGFLIIAWIVWPIYIPFALWKLESVPIRKKILLWILVLGILTSAVLIYVILFRDVKATILDCSVAYTFESPPLLTLVFGILYLIPTVFSIFVSSIDKIWWLGVINILGYFMAKIYFDGHLLSVWCFFAALTSVIILWIVTRLNDKTEP